MVYPIGTYNKTEGLSFSSGAINFGTKNIVPTIGVKQLEGASIKFINLGFEKNIIGK
ncbi:hypothetical protein [Prevotella histicola]|uniref:hypothetical protein n=1 Tax=Prevotella histicola TaxID=470565 RepID=UPI003C763C37